MSETKNEAEITRVEHHDGVACIFFNTGDGAQNVLHDRALSALSASLETLGADPGVEALVIASDKPKSFLAGADIGMLVDRRDDAESISRQAQALMNRIAGLSKPVVAAIHGPCLGGGLELALACTERVASDHRDTRFAQPEVQLGLIPGAGGTQRLPRLIGPVAAIDLMVSGSKVDTTKARRLGLVDEVVPPSILVERAVKRARDLAGSSAPGHEDQWEGNLARRTAVHSGLAQRLLHRQSLKQVRAKTRGNYPAPERLLEVVRTGMADGLEAGLKAEREAFGALARTPEAGHLMWLFQEQRRAVGRGAPWSKDEARPIERVGVIGTGLMGAGIGYVSALQAGVPVRFTDQSDEAILAGLSSIRKLVDGQIGRRRMRSHEGDALMHRITMSTGQRGLEHCDLIVEAVPEVLELKQKLLSGLEARGGASMILASNTSSIPIARIAQALKSPERAIGMHYFSPVERMPLLEIIKTPQTADWVVASCAEFGKRQGKTVIVVRDSPGFYTSRIVAALFFEAMALLSEGVRIDAVDDAIRDFGFPVGPFKLMDEIGIDVVNEIGQVLVDAFPERLEPALPMQKLIEADRAGRKSGGGFYRYGDDGPEVDDSVYALFGLRDLKRSSPQAIVERCVLRMVNESIHCLDEGVLEQPRDGDLGAVLGLGFPPFLGGPFHFADAMGAEELCDRLDALRAHHGPNFEPAESLRGQVTSGGGFYKRHEQVPQGVRSRFPGEARAAATA